MDSFGELFTAPIIILGSFVFFLILILTPIYRWISTMRKYNGLTREIPEPPRPSWLGHDSIFTGDMKYIAFCRSLSKLGTTVRLIHGMLPTVFAVHPDSAKVMLSRADPKNVSAWNFTKPWLGEGLFTSSGDKWFRNRKLLTHTFHHSTLKAYVPLIQSCVQKHMDLWAERWKQNEESIDVTGGMKAATLNCFIAIALGDSTLTASEMKSFQEATDIVANLVYKRIGYLPHHIGFLYNLSTNGRRFYKNVSVLQDIIQQVLRRSKTSLEKGEEKHFKSFVELMIEAKDEDGNGLTDQEIFDEINTFVFAGYDTTGSAIPFCIYYLARHPDSQKKCREEIKSVFRDKEVITWNDLSQLNFMTMCIKETLRLAGPSMLVFRQMGRDSTLPDGLSVPQGVNTGVMMEAIHYDEQIWENPDEFKPERFSPENSDKRHPYAFLPFSAGPRNCIGQNFAMVEMKIFLVLTLRRFHIAVDERKPLVMSVPLLRGADGGIWIKLNPVDI